MFWGFSASKNLFWFRSVFAKEKTGLWFPKNCHCAKLAVFQQFLSKVLMRELCTVKQKKQYICQKPASLHGIWPKIDTVAVYLKNLTEYVGF